MRPSPASSKVIYSYSYSVSYLFLTWVFHLAKCLIGFGGKFLETHRSQFQVHLGLVIRMIIPFNNHRLSNMTLWI